jgi:rhodanese-related sulfurtransferase
LKIDAPLAAAEVRKPARGEWPENVLASNPARSAYALTIFASEASAPTQEANCRIELVPEPEIGERLAELPKDKLIVLYCCDTWCSLATSAAVVLLNNGYRAKELYGGIAAWETLHLPEVEMNSDGLAAGRG